VERDTDAGVKMIKMIFGR